MKGLCDNPSCKRRTGLQRPPPPEIEVNLPEKINFIRLNSLFSRT
jgi:hypothetical protein